MPTHDIMKIAIPLIGFSNTGGYRVLSRLASQWSDWGHDVVMIAHRTSRHPYFPVSCKILWVDNLGRESEWTGPVNRRGLASKVHVAAQLFALSRALNRYFQKFDVILANHSLTAFPVRWNHTNTRKFYYIQAYEPEYYDLQSGWTSPVLSRLSALSYRLGLCQIVNGQIYCDYKEIRTPYVVPPGVDETLFRPANGQRNHTTDKFIIGCVGRKELGKGTRYVVDAFRLLSALDKRYVLRVAYGNLPESCKNLTGIEVVVPKNDAELADYYRSVHVMVAPGTVQLGAFHYPVMEAMACGIPVITTGYLPANSERAWIVPVHDSQSIARAIQNIANNPESAMQKVSLGLEAMNSFSWPSVAASMLSIFHEEPVKS